MSNNTARKQFDEQFIRAQRHIFRYVAALVPNPDDADEVFQAACLKILEKWEAWDSSRPMTPWACGIAQNMVRKHFDGRRRRGQPLSDMVLAAVAETQHRLGAEVDLRLQKLPDCMRQLSEEQRRLIEQCYARRGSVRDVAAAEQLDPMVIYKRLERIRRNLFECIELAVAKERGE
jgi:RNA polymerase sigma-70 factor